jgi:hypothetical protein
MTFRSFKRKIRAGTWKIPVLTYIERGKPHPSACGVGIGAEANLGIAVGWEGDGMLLVRRALTGLVCWAYDFLMF